MAAFYTRLRFTLTIRAYVLRLHLSRRLEVIPRQCNLLEYYAATYACKACEEKTGY